MHNYGSKPTIQTYTDIHGANTQAVAGQQYRFFSQDATFQFPDAIPNVAPFGTDDFETFMLTRAKEGFTKDGKFNVDYAEITCTKTEQILGFPIPFSTKYTFNADVYVTCLHNPFVIDDIIVIAIIVGIIAVIIAVVAYTWTWTLQWLLTVAKEAPQLLVFLVIGGVLSVVAIYYLTRSKTVRSGAKKIARTAYSTTREYAPKVYRGARSVVSKARKAKEGE